MAEAPQQPKPNPPAPDGKSYVQGGTLYTPEELPSKMIKGAHGRWRFRGEIGLREIDWFFGTNYTQEEKKKKK